MKKICMLLALLSGVAFAAGNQGDTGCKVQELGDCQYLYTCENSISMVVTKKPNGIISVTPGNKAVKGCDDTIIKKELIDMQNKQIVNLDGNK